MLSSCETQFGRVRCSNAHRLSHGLRTRRRCLNQSNEDAKQPASRPEPSPQRPAPDSFLNDSAALFNSLSAIARSSGRPGNSTNVVLASDASEETWRKLDKRVNKYPDQRVFTAIGSGGTDFQAAMVDAVQRVVGSVHCECVSARTRGAYISVRVGPVWVENGDQVLAIYENMRADARLRFFI
ncbi:hypothetical protein V8C86DRAFT_2632229 [Haematococcus lacustris]|nr:hypothetical protein QJQ45_021033 [Haematococcus lacustris]